MESPIYLGTEKPGKLLLKFAVPCIFSLIISCLYNIVDQIFVGNGVGYLGNAATGVIFPVTVIGWGISLFFGDGAAAALSVSLGKNETEHIHRSVGNSILCSFLGGAALILISYIWGDGLLRLIGATDANLALAHDYGFIIYTMIPLALAQNTMASIIRADGSPKYAMGAMLAGAVLNIIGDPVAIFALDMGIKGAAYATILGQFVSFCICAAYLTRSRSFRLSLSSFRLEWRLLKQVMALGASSFLTQLSIVIITIVNNILLVKYGALSPYGPDIPLGAFVVIMNHRSAPRLVALQRTMYDSLNEQATQVETSSKWNPADGDIDLLITDNEELEAQAIAEDIASEIANGTRPNEICILCKQRPKDYASAIISKLKTHGISARIETEYQDLIKEPVIDLLFRMILCASNKKRPHDWEYILNFLVGLNGIGTNQVYQEYDQVQEALASQIKYLKTELAKGMDQIYLSNVLNSLINFLDADKIKANFPEYRQKNRLKELIAKFKELFWENMNEANGDWELAVEIFQGFHSVPIMTIHKSKGLEYSSTYFVGLEDSAFWSFRTQPEEDRCAFFVALSRAKRSITFTYCKRRTNLKYPQQSHRDINEFFELLQQPGMANIKELVKQK
jgi:hypothetical protein